MSDQRPPPGLAAFFEHMTPFLDGRAPTPARAFEALGTSPSAPHRFDFYRDLMAANRQRILRYLYPRCHAWVGRTEARWPELAAEYGRGHRTEHWDLNQDGAAFPGFLAERFPDSGVDELADLEWTEFTLVTAPGRFDPAREPVNPACEVRMYTVRVDRFDAKNPGDLAREPVTLILYRHPTRDCVQRFRPSREGLCAFAIAQGELTTEAALAAGLEAAALDAARDQLARAGILRVTGQ